MCADCEYEDLVDRIDALLTDEGYAWAEHTLSSIKETVKSMEHATERQLDAIDNIEAVVEGRR